MWTRDYGLYWSSSLSVAFRLWVQRLSIAWLARKIKGFGFWLGLVALALAFLLFSGQLDQYGLLAFAMLNSIVSVIQQPVRMSLTARLVEKPQIPKTVTYMTINAYLGRCFTPMIIRPVLAFGEVLTAFSSFACLFRVMVTQLPFIHFGN